MLISFVCFQVSASLCYFIAVLVSQKKLYGLDKFPRFSDLGK